jgi:hypothetical protein
VVGSEGGGGGVGWEREAAAARGWRWEAATVGQRKGMARGRDTSMRRGGVGFNGLVSMGT